MSDLILVVRVHFVLYLEEAQGFLYLLFNILNDLNWLSLAIRKKMGEGEV